MKSCVIGCALALLWPSIILAGPFGLDMGMSLNDLKGRTSMKPTSSPVVFETVRVPNPHPAFESYLMFVSPKLGLCKITGIGNTVATSVYGERIRSEFDGLHEQLIQKYGASNKYDYLKQGSIWNEPKDWMIGLRKNERVLRAFWPREGTELPGSEITGIVLDAKAISSEQGYVSLAYEFKNFDECVKESKSKSKDAL